MIDFLASIVFLGWLIFAAIAACLWNLPKFIRGKGSRPYWDEKMRPGEDPPIFRPPRDNDM